MHKKKIVICGVLGVFCFDSSSGLRMHGNAYKLTCLAQAWEDSGRDGESEREENRRPRNSIESRYASLLQFHSSLFVVLSLFALLAMNRGHW